MAAITEIKKPMSSPYAFTFTTTKTINGKNGKNASIKVREKLKVDLDFGTHLASTLNYHKKRNSSYPAKMS